MNGTNYRIILENLYIKNRNIKRYKVDIIDYKYVGRTDLPSKGLRKNSNFGLETKKLTNSEFMYLFNFTLSKYPPCGRYDRIVSKKEFSSVGELLFAYRCTLVICIDRSYFFIINLLLIINFLQIILHTNWGQWCAVPMCRTSNEMSSNWSGQKYENNS